MMVNVFFSLRPLSTSGRCCLDGSSIHQPIFCCSSYSPQSSPPQCDHIILTISLVFIFFFGIALFLLVLISSMVGFVYLSEITYFVFLIKFRFDYGYGLVCCMFCPRYSKYLSIVDSSTTLALITILHHVLQRLERKNTYARILLIDFSKAFDHIDHNILLNKLKTNGVPQICVEWQKAFLTSRTKSSRVKLANAKTDWTEVAGGVLQGTLSGPENFLNMIDDLHTEVDDVKFVDDVTLYEVCNTHSQKIWAAVFTFNPYLLISINEIIDINNSFIDINKYGHSIHLY